MGALLEQLFDRTTIGGLLALGSIHAHLLWRDRRQAKLERVQAALVKGHVAGVQAHRDLVLELPKAAQ